MTGQSAHKEQRKLKSGL